MNRAELVKEIAGISDITMKDANVVLSATLEAITNGMIKDGKVVLVGFGTFKVKEASARKGRNPQTGEEMAIPAKKKPKFTAGKKLKEAVL
jgi:DNA-binding protein HU-beta